MFGLLGLFAIALPIDSEEEDNQHNNNEEQIVQEEPMIEVWDMGGEFTLSFHASQACLDCCTKTAEAISNVVVTLGKLALVANKDSTNKSGKRTVKLYVANKKSSAKVEDDNIEVTLNGPITLEINKDQSCVLYANKNYFGERFTVTYTLDETEYQVAPKLISHGFFYDGKFSRKPSSHISSSKKKAETKRGASDLKTKRNEGCDCTCRWKKSGYKATMTMKQWETFKQQQKEKENK